MQIGDCSRLYDNVLNNLEALINILNKSVYFLTEPLYNYGNLNKSSNFSPIVL